jgi:nucleoside-diphosphate-sugar epimerase
VTRRVLVTGATGFVGRALVKKLVAKGYDVRAPVRSIPNGEIIADFRLIDDIETAPWTKLLSGVEAVVHLAGLAHAGGAYPATEYERINCAATLRLAGMSAGRVGRFTFISSVRAQSGPVNNEILNEDSDPVPSDLYGRSKLNAERGLVKSFPKAVILRPVAVYGLGVSGNLGLLQQLANSPVPLPLANLTAPRSFLAIDNLINAICFCFAGDVDGRTFLVADAVPLHVAGLIVALRRGMGRPTRLFGMSSRWLGSVATAIGCSRQWAPLAGPLVVDVSALPALGWTAPIVSTAVGAGQWGKSARRR